MTEYTEAELIAALNAELEAQGYSHRVEHGVYRGAETDARIKRAIEAIVKLIGRPAKHEEIVRESGVARTTVNSALKRLVERDEIVGAAAIGYIVRGKG